MSPSRLLVLVPINPSIVFSLLVGYISPSYPSQITIFMLYVEAVLPRSGSKNHTYGVYIPTEKGAYLANLYHIHILIKSSPLAGNINQISVNFDQTHVNHL